MSKPMHIAIHQLAQMMDVYNGETVDISIDTDGDKIWVNVNDSCLMRIMGVKSIRIHDERNGTINLVDKRDQTP